MARPLTSRWSIDPIVRKDGTHHAVLPKDLTSRDIEILDLLDPDRYRYLSVKFIAAFVKGHQKSVRDRLNILSREPNLFLRRPLKQKPLIGLYRHQLFERAERGTELMRDRGRATTERLVTENARELPHQVMIDAGFASIDLATRETTNMRFIYPREILNSPRFPEETRGSDRPLTITVDISYRFPGGRTERLTFPYRNDGLRGIEYTDEAGAKSYRFINFEAENRNRVRCSNLDQTSFLKKWLAISHIMKRENRLYRTRWGLPNLMTLVVARSQHHIDTMKNFILEETQGRGCPYIAFQKVAPLDEDASTLTPMPALFSGPWQRAGQEDFYLNKA